ncbi:Thioesterase superfamily protein (fragment) [Parafrankia sp. Ea1.12]|uniref:PaaI family thioesterase n=1 Tax=Parafrankia sp. Ea1.12 TaxID=573499 RepID=UPI000DA5D0DE
MNTVDNGGNRGNVDDVRHIVMELGLGFSVDDGVATGRADVFAELCVPGTTALRTSVLATWADIVTGVLALNLTAPRPALTLDLDVQVVEPAEIGDTISLKARTVKAGRTVAVCETQFRNETSGTLTAVCHTSFVTSPNPDHVFSHGALAGLPEGPFRLPVPLTERVGSVIVAPGTVEVPHRADGLNAGGAIQGGLVALATEEAATSSAQGPTVVTALGIRYLRPFSVGPARAVADRHGEVCLVHLTDAGTGKLGAVATARLADAKPR